MPSTIQSFNSTLVQLKECGRRKKLLRNTGFNSTLVQLKEIFQGF